MALKDWKISSARVEHWDTADSWESVSKGEADVGEADVIALCHPFDEWFVVRFNEYGQKKIGKLTKKRSEALKFAKDYMRKHK